MATRRRYADDWNDKERRCTRCGDWLPWEDFGVRAAGRNGRNSVCTQCVRLANLNRKRADPAAHAAHRKKWDIRYGGHTRRVYGITPLQKKQLAARQGGRCALCREVPVRRLVVDQEPQTGTVRGLLCDRCRHRVRQLEEDNLIRPLVAYVSRYRRT